MTDQSKITDYKKLPSFWDGHFYGNIFLGSAFVRHLAATNPARQYCFHFGEGTSQITAGTIYRTRLPFCLGPVCISAPVSVCGIPMVYGSRAGFIPESDFVRAVEAMEGSWPGFQMVVGLSRRGDAVPGWSWKRHLITVGLDIGWNDFTGYLEAMRSDYRKQIMTSRRKWKGIRIDLQKGADFDDKDYLLFLDMYRAARDKSIPLSVEFFRQIPIEHRYLKAFDGKGNLGWALLIPEGQVLHLLYLGYDIPRNREFDIYINLLLESVKYAIENKYKRLEMGQTAELIKMRIGGIPAERHILVRHTNPAINQIIKRTDIFNFRKHYPPLHVFKADDR